VLALLTIYYTWPLKVLRWPVLFLNIAVLVATPIQGGHHLIDVLGAIPVTALALFAAGKLRQRAGEAEIETAPDNARPLARPSS
jgi:membrane-associated phospholipid phosphatase